MDRGNRIYNGIPCQLMNDIYDILIQKDETVIDSSWWAVFSLYLCRTCNILERKGWKYDKRN